MPGTGERYGLSVCGPSGIGRYARSFEFGVGTHVEQATEVRLPHVPEPAGDVEDGARVGRRVVQHDESEREEVVQCREESIVCCHGSPVMHRQRREVCPPRTNGWTGVAGRRRAEERVAIERRHVAVAEGHVGERAVATCVDDFEVDGELMRIDESLCADEIDLGRILAAFPEPERWERDELTVTLNGDDRPVAFALHDELLHGPRLCPPARPVRASSASGSSPGRRRRGGDRSSALLHNVPVPRTHPANGAVGRFST